MYRSTKYLYCGADRYVLPFYSDISYTIVVIYSYKYDVMIDACEDAVGVIKRREC